MRQPRYERDSEALEAIYGLAHAELAQRFRMDDDHVTRLISLVLKVYFSQIDRDDCLSTASSVVREFEETPRDEPA